MADRRWTSPWIAVGIFALALVLRLACILSPRHDLLFDHPAIDQADYVEWARLIATSGCAEPHPFPRPPGIAYALALVFRLAGDGLLEPRVLQAVLSALACVLVLGIGRTWFSGRIAVAAALVTALHAVLIHASSEILPTTWVLFFDLLALWTLARAERTQAARWLLAGGVVLGFSTLFLPTILLFVPVVVVWAWTRMPHRVRAVGLVVAGLVAVVLPVTVRNAVRGHDRVLVASNDGINFWIGNNPDYERTFAIRPGRAYQDLEWEPVERGIVKPSAQSAYYYKKALRFMAEEPLRAAGLELRKLYLYFHGAEIPRSSDIYLARTESPVLRALVWRWPVRFPDALLMPLALVGLGASWRQRRRRLLPLGFVLTQVVAVCAFFVCSRYRAPALPVWSLFACAGAGWLAQALREGGWGRRMALAAGFVIAVVLLEIPTHETRLDLRAEETFYRAEGAFEERDDVTARRLFEETIALDPKNNDAWDLLGHVLQRHGDTDGAIAAWRRAAALDPFKVETGRTLAGVLEKRGDLDGAIAALHANLAYLNDPRSYANDYSQDLVLLARLYLERGDRQRALDAAQSAVQFNPENAEAARTRDAILESVRSPADGSPPGPGRVQPDGKGTRAPADSLPSARRDLQ